MYRHLGAVSCRTGCPGYLEGEPTVIVRNVTGGGAIGGGNEFFRRARDGRHRHPGHRGAVCSCRSCSATSRSSTTTRPGSRRSPRRSAAWSTCARRMRPRAPRALLDAGNALTSARSVRRAPTSSRCWRSRSSGSTRRSPSGSRGAVISACRILRGELDIDYQTTSSYLRNVQPLIDDGTMTALFAWGVLDDEGNVQRDPTFPDLPSFRGVPRDRALGHPRAVPPGRPGRPPTPPRSRIRSSW